MASVPLDPTGDDDDGPVDRRPEPASRWENPEQPFDDPERSDLIPEAPSVNSYEVDDADSGRLAADLGDVDPDLLNTFTVSVVLTNLGVLLVCLGLLLAIFRSQWQLGGGLVVVGSLALVRVWQHYRSFKQERDHDEDEKYEGNGDSDDAAERNG